MKSVLSSFLIAIALVVSICEPATAQSRDRGIEGKIAPAWKTSSWHQLPGERSSLDVADFKGKVIYLYFFQSWCPGCHRIGFPTLKALTDKYRDDDSVAFVAIQTTFEGHHTNTADKLAEMSKRYQLSIPFGQSAGESGTPDIMRAYRTGGTPWVVIIDPQGRVRFNDYHIKPAQAAQIIEQLRN